MKKNEYVSPEMEIVEIETQSLLDNVSFGNGNGPGFNGRDDVDDNQDPWN